LLLLISILVPVGPDKEAEVLDYIVTNGRARGSSIQDWGHQSSPLLLGIWVHPTPLMTLLQEVDLKPLEVGNVLAVFDPLFSFRPQTAAMPSTSVKLLSKQSSLSKQKSNIYGQTTQRPMVVRVCLCEIILIYFHFYFSRRRRRPRPSLWQIATSTPLLCFQTRSFITV